MEVHLDMFFLRDANRLFDFFHFVKPLKPFPHRRDLVQTPVAGIQCLAVLIISPKTCSRLLLEWMVKVLCWGIVKRCSVNRDGDSGYRHRKRMQEGPVLSRIDVIATFLDCKVEGALMNWGAKGFPVVSKKGHTKVLFPCLTGEACVG